MREPSEVPSKTTVAVAAPTGSWLRRFLVREDAGYRPFEGTYQAKSARAKITYLLLYLVSGLFAYLAINVEPTYAAELSLTRLSARNLQFAWILAVMCGWYMFVPFLVLRFADKLTLRESFAFLGLNRVDWRGLLRVLPPFCAVFALVSLPYIKFICAPLQGWLHALDFTVGKSLVFGQEIAGKQAGEPGFRELAILDLESGRISRVPDSRTKWGAFWPAQQLLVAGGEQSRLTHSKWQRRHGQNSQMVRFRTGFHRILNIFTTSKKPREIPKRCEFVLETEKLK